VAPREPLAAAQRASARPRLAAGARVSGRARGSLTSGPPCDVARCQRLVVRGARESVAPAERASARAVEAARGSVEEARESLTSGPPCNVARCQRLVLVERSVHVEGGDPPARDGAGSGRARRTVPPLL
jgi:hypothetical protein